MIGLALEMIMVMRFSIIVLAVLFPQLSSFALTLTEGSSWTSFPIRVCFEDPKPEHKQDRLQIKTSVLQSWAKESAVSFAGWAPCRERPQGIRIRLIDGHPKTLARGRHIDGVAGGMELPKLWGLAALSINGKATVHEFGHALGFGHEYARADAPYQDACGVMGWNNRRYLEDDLAITSFDFDSIMVACVRDATRNFSVGVPKLSAGDIYGLIKTYGSAPENVLDADEAGDRFGHSLAVGDFNGDAIPDLAVGAPGETLTEASKPRGAVYLYKGDDVSGLRPWGRLVNDDSFGFGSMLKADHLNNDRRHDLIVEDADGRTSVFAGRSRGFPRLWDDVPHVSSIESPANDIVASVEPFDIENASGDIDFGRASMLADLDADGHDDLIISAPDALVDGVRSGLVFVYRSPETDHPWKRRPGTFTPWYRFGQAY